MAGAEKLIEKIENDAQRDAEKYWQDAENKKQDMQGKMLSSIDKCKSDIEKTAVETAQENKKRMAAVYDLEYRKQLLAAKQEIMQQTKALALQKLCSLDDSRYISLMKSRLLKCSQTGEGGIIVSENDARLDKAFLDDVNGELKKTLGQGNIVFLPEKKEISGGFVFVDGGMEINMSLEALLDEAWEDAEAEVAEVLFE